jgi:hypothetical protein
MGVVETVARELGAIGVAPRCEHLGEQPATYDLAVRLLGPLLPQRVE